MLHPIARAAATKQCGRRLVSRKRRKFGRQDMRFTMVLIMGLAMALGAPANAQSFLGSWSATADMGGGMKSSETLSVARSDHGYSVAAKSNDPQSGAPEAGPGMDVALQGDTFSYTRTISIGGNDIVIRYAGAVSGDTFTGTADLGGTKVPYTGVRIPAGKSR
jgi:hypothetical protein